MRVRIVGLDTLDCWIIASDLSDGGRIKIEPPMTGFDGLEVGRVYDLDETEGRLSPAFPAEASK